MIFSGHRFVFFLTVFTLVGSHYNDIVYAFQARTPFELLGLQPEPFLDKAAIKAAYKRMARKYHPDVVVNHDSTPEEKHNANEVFASIIGAYKFLMDRNKLQEIGAVGSNFSPSSHWSSGFTSSHGPSSAYNSPFDNRGASNNVQGQATSGSSASHRPSSSTYSSSYWSSGFTASDGSSSACGSSFNNHGTDADSVQEASSPNAYGSSHESSYTDVYGNPHENHATRTESGPNNYYYYMPNFDLVNGNNFGRHRARSAYSDWSNGSVVNSGHEQWHTTARSGSSYDSSSSVRVESPYSGSSSAASSTGNPRIVIDAWKPQGFGPNERKVSSSWDEYLEEAHKQLFQLYNELNSNRRGYDSAVTNDDGYHEVHSSPTWSDFEMWV